MRSRTPATRKLQLDRKAGPRVFAVAIVSPVGFVTTGQRIRGETGLCTNFISLEGEKRPFDQLEIEIQMTPLTESRVRLDFLRGRAKNANAPLPFLRDFSFNFLPLWVGDFLCFLRGRNPQTDPPAYFDVLYLDNELRVHQTGEGKVFVQTRG